MPEPAHTRQPTSTVYATPLLTPTTALCLSIRLSVFELREIDDWDIFRARGKWRGFSPRAAARHSQHARVYKDSRRNLFCFVLVALNISPKISPIPPILSCPRFPTLACKDCSLAVGKDCSLALRLPRARSPGSGEGRDWWS